jgi:hypothetical protein
MILKINKQKFEEEKEELEGRRKKKKKLDIILF